MRKRRVVDTTSTANKAEGGIATAFSGVCGNLMFDRISSRKSSSVVNTITGPDKIPDE
jgi:hypothetical protein